jgi:hypothetical protein
MKTKSWTRKGRIELKIPTSPLEDSMRVQEQSKSVIYGMRARKRETGGKEEDETRRLR